MAAEVLTDRGFDHLFDHPPPHFGHTMSHDFRGPAQPPFQHGVEGVDHPTLYSEASGSTDGMPPPPVEVAPSTKKRKPSKMKVPPELRRPASTPQIRGVTQGETSPLASPTSEKRRNKLGYHRTSVACGHCRRRKIRCLVGADETQGRCLNCIRLKKDCHFFPVDQGPIDAKSRPPASTEAGSKIAPTSSHSSPRNSGASDSVDDVSRIASHQSQQPFSIHSSKQSSELEYSDSPIDGGSFQSPTFSYQGMPDSSHWGQPTFFTGPPMSDDPNTPQSAGEYWGQQHPPNSAIFQHRGSIPVGLDQQAAYYVPQTPETQPHPWAGMRSMSVGDASQLPPNFQPPYRQPGFQNQQNPYAYTHASTSSLPLGPVDQMGPGGSVPTHVLPSQTIPNEWGAYAQPDVGTPIAEHGVPPFAQQWYDQQHGGQGPNPG